MNCRAEAENSLSLRRTFLLQGRRWEECAMVAAHCRCSGSIWQNGIYEFGKARY